MSWPARVALSLLLALAAYSTVPSAQDRQSIDLFTTVPAAVTDSFAAAALVRPDTTAARAVAVNPAAFDAERLQIDLFGGASLVAERRLMDGRTSNARVWDGTIPGSPSSSVTLVEVDGMVQGSIRTLDEAYSIEPLASEGVYALRQVDTSRSRPELPPARVPAMDAAADLSTPQLDDGSRFDVLVIYNEAARSASGSDAGVRARISLGIAETNTAFANSQAAPRLRLVGAEFVDYTQDPNIAVDLGRLRLTTDGFLDAVHARRDALGADLVQLIVGPQTNACGIGYLMDTLSSSFAPWAFSVTAYDCISPNYTVAHELAHNMGSNHAPEDMEPGDPTLYPYSFGYKHPARLFRTVMAYDCASGGCPRVLNFSNPNVSRSGAPTGTAAGNDNARSINNARLTVANWRAATDVAPPTISAIAAQDTNEDTPTSAIPFTIGDPDTTLANLVVSASSSNAALVPNTPAALTLAGTGANRTLVVSPAANQFGSATIAVSVSDASTTVSTSFVLTVAAVNDAPAIAFNPASASLPQGVAAESIVTVSDIDTPGLSLFLSATSSNQSLLTDGGIAITPVSSTAGSRTFRATMTPLASEYGSATVSFVANDFGVGGTTAGTFSLTVRARPTVSTIDSQSMQEDAALTVPFTVGDPDTPVGSLRVTASSSDPALVAAEGLDLGGSGSSRSLTITPNANAHGSATITIAVGDGAQTVQRAFALTVTPVNDAPAFHALTATSVTLASGRPATFYVTLTDPDSTPETLTLSGVPSNAALLPSVVITPGATIAAGRQFAVTLTSASGGIGSTSLGLTASDPQSGASTRSVAAVIVAAPVVPNPPLNLSAAASDARVTLEWFAARTGAPATSYSVEIGTAPGTTTLPTQTTTAPVTTFSADLPDGLYFVRVRGVNGAGASAPSSEAVVAVGTAALLPGPPANFIISTFRTSATLSWTASTVGQPAASYVIEAGSAPGLANLARLATTGPAASFVVPFVPQGTYFVRVRGRNQAGAGAPSQDVSIVMGPRGQCLGPAHAPVLLTPVVNGNTVTLSWNAAATGGPAESYIIGAGSAPGLVNLALFDTNSSGTSFAASAPNGVYYVRVAASNPCGRSPASNEASFTLGPELPRAPSGLQASVSPDRRVSLTWTPPAGGGAPTGYLVQAGNAPGLSNLAVVSTGSTAPAFTAVAPPGVYHVRVRALNGAGPGPASNEIVVVVP